jgi:hypothetical protein
LNQTPRGRVSPLRTPRRRGAGFIDEVIEPGYLEADSRRRMLDTKRDQNPPKEAREHTALVIGLNDDQ